jgi:hypothetical protein
MLVNLSYKSMRKLTADTRKTAEYDGATYHDQPYCPAGFTDFSQAR